MNELEPLDDDLRALLHEAEGELEAPPEGAMARVLDDVSHTIADGATRTPSGLRIPGLVVGGGMVLGLALAVALVIVRVNTRPVAERPPVVVEEKAPLPPWGDLDAPKTPELQPVVVEPAKPPKKRMPLASDTLDNERLVLDEARAALQEADGDSARDALDRYRTRFPEGQLREEHAALQIWLLVVEKSAQAPGAAAEFRERYPRSIHRALVDALEN